MALMKFLFTKSTAAALMLFFSNSAHAQPVYFVDKNASGTETGATWADAFLDPSPALAAAQPGEEVWIADGTYTICGSDATFAIPPGVGVYGGFDGGEPHRELRDHERYVAVLAGCDEQSRFPPLHVVTTSPADRSSTLDGFTIQGGLICCALERGGAGIYNNGGSPFLRNLVLKDNVAFHSGGGMLSVDGHPVVIGSTFEENRAYVDNGGPVYGGAIHVSGGSLTVINSRFIRNSAGGSNRFDGRYSIYGNGGAVGAQGDARLTIINSIFDGNATFGEPGCTMVLSCSGGQSYGGAIYVYNSVALVLNSTFRENKVDTTTGSAGGSIYVDELTSNSVVIRNSIFGGSNVSEIYGDAVVSHSIVKGGHPGTEVRDVDPEWSTFPELMTHSPAVDAGSSDFLIPDEFDLDGDHDTSELIPIDAQGNPRVIGGAVDLGAVENQVALSGEEHPDVLSPSQLQFYPNPARSSGTVVFAPEFGGSFRLGLVDAAGRHVVHLQSGSVSAGQTLHLALETTALPGGVYFLQLEHNGKRQVMPITVLH